MNKQHIEDIIRHEFKKTTYTIAGIVWEEYESYPGETITEAVICLNETFVWKKLYRRYARLENKLNKKYGVNLDVVKA